MARDALHESACLHGLTLPFDASPGTEARPIPRVEDIYQSHFKYVHRQLTRLGVRPELVDDAAQDVFIVVHKKLPVFDGKVALTTWLYAIALRVARRYRERQGKREPREVEPEQAAGTDPERDAGARMVLERASRALETLDDDKREVFVMAEIEQMSAPEIAAIMGTPVPTVYSRLRLAREAFASALRRQDLARRSR